MRIDIKETKVYPYNELTDGAREKVMEQLRDINVEHDWWEFTYEDAASVGIKITEFDIDRNSYCDGKFTEDVEDVAKKIIEQHGACCTTHETATAFLAEIKAAKIVFEDSVDYDPEYQEFNESEGYDNFVNEFKHSILEDYRIILQHEYEYLTSEEAIVETIEANGYEFTEDGKLY